MDNRAEVRDFLKSRRDKIGPDHTYDTPVYRRGTLTPQGVLQGDLILVASGDITMGGRTNPDGTVAFGNFDDNEANTLGNAADRIARANGPRRR